MKELILGALIVIVTKSLLFIGGYVEKRATSRDCDNYAKFESQGKTYKCELLTTNQ